VKTEKFHSQLGEVAVTRTRIEREREGDWDRIEENFSEEKLVDSMHFSNIKEIRLQKNSVYPIIRMKVDGNWKRMFFHVGDDVDECFNRLNYRWRAFRQTHRG